MLRRMDVGMARVGHGDLDFARLRGHRTQNPMRKERQIEHEQAAGTVSLLLLESRRLRYSYLN